MLICVESGMSVEAAMSRVANEIGSQSVALAEELVLTNAELSYLQERKQAYENLAARTGLDTVKSVAQALMQAERYGTPVAHALRVLAKRKSRPAHERGRKEGRRPAAEADRADDPFLPSGAVCDHSWPGRHPGQRARDLPGQEHIQLYRQVADVLRRPTNERPASRRGAPVFWCRVTEQMVVG
jgi:hypothetical protein